MREEGGAVVLTACVEYPHPNPLPRGEDTRERAESFGSTIGSRAKPAEEWPSSGRVSKSWFGENRQPLRGGILLAARVPLLTKEGSREVGYRKREEMKAWSYRGGPAWLR